MPRKTQNTTSPEPMQATAAPADEWATEVVRRLPENTQQQAKALHAFERSRQIRSATDLLRGLLAYVYTVHSFQHLSIWSVLVGVADVSATDWRKRLQRASAWLTWLLQEVLAASTAVSPWLVRGGWRRILLIDGTHFTCPGPLGMVWRVHTAFDLLAGRLTQLKVTDRQVGEQLEVFELQAGDLVIRDPRQWLARTHWLCAEQRGRSGGSLYTAQSAPARGKRKGDPGGEVAQRTPCPGRTRVQPTGVGHASGPEDRVALDRAALEPRATGSRPTAQEADRDQETTAGAGRHPVSGGMGPAGDHLTERTVE